MYKEIISRINKDDVETALNASRLEKYVLALDEHTPVKTLKWILIQNMVTQYKDYEVEYVLGSKMPINSEIAQILATHERPNIKMLVAKNLSTPEDVLKILANDNTCGVSAWAKRRLTQG